MKTFKETISLGLEEHHDREVERTVEMQITEYNKDFCTIDLTEFLEDIDEERGFFNSLANTHLSENELSNVIKMLTAAKKEFFPKKVATK